MNKRERFQQWRGAEAVKEQYQLETAELIALYADSVKNIDSVKEDLKDHQSPKFVDFNRLKHRSIGALLLFKLVIDDIQSEQTPLKNTLLSSILTELSATLTLLYETPEKAASSGCIDTLINSMRRLTQLEDGLFTDKQQAKKLFFTAYVVFSLVEPTLNSLHWLILPLVQRYVNSTALKKSIKELLRDIETKAKNFITEDLKDSDTLGSRLFYFKHSYINILNNTKNLDQLESEMQKNTTNIARLIELRQSKTTLDLKLQRLSRLFDAAKTNDRNQSEGRFYLELRSTHSEAFTLLLAHIQEEKKALFIKLTQTLENETLNLQSANGLSLITGALTQIYLIATPQLIQNIATEFMPSSLGGECTKMLKESVQEYLDDTRSSKSM